MNYKKSKKLLRGTAALLLATAMMVTATPAFARVAKSQSATSFVSTELTKNNGSIKISINNTQLLATFVFKGYTQYSLYGLTCDHQHYNGDAWTDRVVVDENGNATLQADLSELKNTSNDLWIYHTVNKYNPKDISFSCTGFMKINIQKKSGKYAFYSPAGKSEKSFRSMLDKKYSPKKNRSPYYTKNLKYASQIKSKTKAIIKDCKSNEAKTKAIHDWLAKNIQYNYEALYSGSYDAQWNSADPDWVYKHKKAICSGYARLARVMFTYAGVPCLNIVGKADGIKAGVDYSGYTDSNHEWNAVYLNGSWRLLDITWDSPNKYYGTGGTNVKGQAPRYTYYGITPFALGMDHHSVSVS